MIYVMEFSEAWDEACSVVGLTARWGKLADMRAMIRSGAAVDISDNRGWRPMHEAAAVPSNLNCLAELLEHDKTNVNWLTHEGETALLLACKRRRGKSAQKAVELLLHHGADANIGDNEDETPLLAATRFGETAVVELLIQSGNADPNTGDCSGWRPLHEAATHGKLSMVQCLLDGDAAIDVQDECGMTPIFTAAQHGQAECLRELVRVANEKGKRSLIDLGAQDWATPLMIAAQQGFSECVQVLLENGANADLLTRDCASALHMAVQKNCSECVQLLLEKMTLEPLIMACHPSIATGKDVQNTLGIICPLHLAVEWNSHECLQLLLDAGFSPDSVYDCQYPFSDHRFFLGLPRYDTALSYAVHQEDLNSMKILLNAGASVNALCSDTCHPLYRGLLSRKINSVNMLLELGCDINYQRKNIPSNECMLIAFFDYAVFKKLLMLGLDPHLCFRETSAVAINMFKTGLFSRDHNVDQDIIIQQLQLLLNFTVITTNVKVYFNESAKSARRAYPENFKDNAWYELLQEVGKLTSLKNMCRINVRQYMLASFGPAFISTISNWEFPTPLKDYLLYKDLMDEI